MLRRWNAQYPNEAYSGTGAEASFHRVYHRALEKVAHPEVRLIGRKLSPAKQRRRQQLIEEVRARDERLAKSLKSHIPKYGNRWLEDES